MSHDHGRYVAGCPHCRRKAADRQNELRSAGRIPPADAHGKHSTYVNYECRCEPCKDARRAYQREYGKRRRRELRALRIAASMTRTLRGLSSTPTTEGNE